MGIRSRRKRLEHFEQRAEDFDVALMEGGGGQTTDLQCEIKSLYLLASGNTGDCV